MQPDVTLPILLAILFLGILLPDMFRKLKLPFVSILMFLGAILGPNGMAYFELTETISLFGFLGSAFLMLLAGLEVKTDLIKKDKRIYTLAGINSIIPFIVGGLITQSFGYGLLPSLMVGTVFASSSVMLITAVLRHRRTGKSGKLIQGAVVLEDGLSLLFLSLVLQSVNPITEFPLPIYVGILISSIIILKMFLPEVAKYYIRRIPKKDQYEGQLRFVIVVLIAVLLYFNGLGVHPILASFIVGALLTESIGKDKIYEKVHTLGYGLFVPVFFFIVGMEMDLKLLTHLDSSNMLIISIILGSILSKSITGYIAGRYVGFNKKYSALFGTATTAQLTTTLAATYAASSLGVLDPTLVTAILLLSMITAMFMPIIFAYIARGNHA